jgi:hypothetical protein
MKNELQNLKQPLSDDLRYAWSDQADILGKYSSKYKVRNKKFQLLIISISGDNRFLLTFFGHFHLCTQNWVGRGCRIDLLLCIFVKFTKIDISIKNQIIILDTLRIITKILNIKMKSHLFNK